MADLTAPPPGLEQFVGEAEPPAAAPTMARAPASDQPVEPPPGLEEFVEPSSFMDRVLGNDPASVRAFNREDHRKQPAMITSALEGAASALTFGGSTGLEVATGLRTPEEIRQTREDHPYANMVGQGVGLVSGALSGEALGGALGLTGRALEGVGTAAGNFTTNRIASAALKSAAETMMVQGGDEVSKAFSQDPHQSIQTAAVNVGLAGLIGAGLGGGTEAVLGKVSPLWQARNGEKTTGVLKDVLNEASNAEEYASMANAGTLVETAPAPGEARSLNASALSETPEKSAYEGILSNGPERPNADLIRQAAADNGIKLGPEALLERSQPLSDSLSKSPSVAGVRHNAELKQIHNKVVDLFESSLSDATPLSKYEAGGKIIDEILEPLKKEGEAIQARFKKLEPVLKQIEASPELKAKAIASVTDAELTRVNPKLRGLQSELAEQIQNIDNLATLKKVRTSINNDIELALPKIGPKDSNKADLLLRAKSAVTDLEEGSIAEAAKASGVGKKGGGEVTSELIDELQAVRRDWGGHKKNLRETGMNLGVGDMYSAASAEAKLFKPGLKDEKFVGRVLDPDNVGVMKFMQERYPEAFETARRYKLKELREASLSNAQGSDKAFQPSSFLNRVNKMSPEARSALFKNSAKAVRDGELLYTGALPKNYNPSGTAAAIKWGDFLSLKGFVDNAHDALRYAVLKGLPVLKTSLGGGVSNRSIEIAMAQAIKSGAPIEAGSFKALVHYVEHVIQGDAEIAHVAKSIFADGSLKLPAVAVNARSRDKLDQQLKALQEDPSPLVNAGGETAYYAPEHGAALGQTAATAVNYLNSLRPNTTKKMPFDSEPKPDRIQQAKFNRALDIAQKPLIALDGIKQGRMNLEDIKTMKTLYPSLYRKITDKMTEQMINAVTEKRTVPYSTRLGVATFTGQPLDSSMTGPSILAAQPKPAQAPAAPKPGRGPSSGGPHSFKAIDKLPQQYQTPGQAREASRGSRR